MNRRILVLLVLFTMIFCGCRKKEASLYVEGANYINEFIFLAADNPGSLKADAAGTFSHDTIRVRVPAGTPVASLVPTISISGRSISAASKTAQDFTAPVHYTVTAANGSVHTYTVIIVFVSSGKKITGFVLKSSLNPGLAHDVNGIIAGDSIYLYLDPDVRLDNLVPTVTHTGAGIFPGNGTAGNFSSHIAYTVTAEDGSTETYSVIAGNNTVIFVGSDDGNLYALYAATGIMKWKYHTAGNRVNTPSFHNGTVLTSVNGGPFFAVDAETGQLKWTYSKYDGVYSNATIDNGKVFFSQVSGRSRISVLFALNESDGKPVFEKELLYTGEVRKTGDPSAAYGNIYVGEGWGGLSAYDEATGDLKLRYYHGWMALGVAIRDHLVYSSVETVLMSVFDAASGMDKWVRSTAEPGVVGFQSRTANSFSAPTLEGNLLYIGSSSYMCALDAGNGSVKWYTPENTAFASPVVGKGLLFAGGTDTRIYAFDAATGKERWVSDEYGNTTNPPSPTYADGVVYAHRSNNFLYALNADYGTLIWKWQVPTSVINSDPCVVDGRGNIFYPGSSGDHN